MPIAELESGSQTATIDTEHTLGTADDGTDGVFQHEVDVAALVRGDELEIRLYDKCRAADTSRQMHMWKIRHAQSDELWRSPVMVFMHARKFTIKQTAGTGRAFPWSVKRVS